MKVTHSYLPSAKTTRLHGVQAALHAQDQAVMHSADGIEIIALIDAAHNFIGRTDYAYPEVAKLRGFEPSTPLNGGEIASSLFADVVRSRPELSGEPLIEALNARLATAYQELGITPDPARRGELFTGYICHLRFTPDTVTVTAVGDCYAAFDGRIVAGAEKAIDQLHIQLIKQYADAAGLTYQEAYAILMPSINAKQFDFQNNPAAKLWYPAIDGTHTPPNGIQHAQFDRRAIESAILWTDGYRPVSGDPDPTVRSLTDLATDHPEVPGERSVLTLTDIAHPGL